MSNITNIDKRNENKDTVVDNNCVKKNYAYNRNSRDVKRKSKHAYKDAYIYELMKDNNL